MTMVWLLLLQIYASDKPVIEKLALHMAYASKQDCEKDKAFLAVKEHEALVCRGLVLTGEKDPKL